MSRNCRQKSSRLSVSTVDMESAIVPQFVNLTNVSHVKKYPGKPVNFNTKDVVNVLKQRLDKDEASALDRSLKQRQENYVGGVRSNFRRFDSEIARTNDSFRIKNHNPRQFKALTKKVLGVVDVKDPVDSGRRSVITHKAHKLAFKHREDNRIDHPLPLHFFHEKPEVKVVDVHVGPKPQKKVRHSEPRNVSVCLDGLKISFSDPSFTSSELHLQKKSQKLQSHVHKQRSVFKVPSSVPFEPFKVPSKFTIPKKVITQ